MSSMTPSQSPENSLQRTSALNISVGDTKSIVLALQALQSKIRQLEKDRDFHHDQYEQAVSSHEAFKRFMETQLEEERTAHRKRENELLALLRQAAEEKNQISSSFGNRDSLAQLRKELETMVEAERKCAARREEQLLNEIKELHQSIKLEKLEHAAVLLKLEKLQTEHERVKQQRFMMPEKRNVQQYTPRDHSQRRAQSTSRNRARSTQGRSRSRSKDSRLRKANRGQTTSSSCPTPSHTCCRCACGREKENSQSFQALYTHSYCDPTCCSMLRDVRNVDGVSPCTHEDEVSLVHARVSSSSLKDPQDSLPHNLQQRRGSALNVSIGAGRDSARERSLGHSKADAKRYEKRTESSPPPHILKTVVPTRVSKEKQMSMQEKIASTPLSHLSVDEMRQYLRDMSAFLERQVGDEEVAPLRAQASPQPTRHLLMNEMRAIASNAINSQRNAG